MVGGKKIMEINNHDIVGLFNRINRFLVELNKAVSSQTSEMNEFDQERLAKYLEAIDTYHDWVVDQPHLDLPETAPRTYVLEEVPVLNSVENESINDVIRILTLVRDELVNSQSARNPANLNKFDSSRLVNTIAKVRSFLEGYIIPITPLDMPESSPKKASSGAGSTGI